MVFVKRLVLLVCIASTAAINGMNLVRPYQILLRPPKVSDSWLQLYAIEQFGFASRAFGSDTEHVRHSDLERSMFTSTGEVNPLQIYQCNQDGLAMFDGFPSCSPIGQRRIRLDASDDGVRGHFVPSAQFDVDAAMHFGMRFFFKHHLSLALYLPFYKMRLHDVCWYNCTQDVSIQDQRVNAYLADDLAGNVCAFGDLDITGWNRSGVGDTTVSLEWIRDYPQKKPLLHNVTINGRLGAVFPSGLKANEDKVLAFSYGNDGAYGIIFAIGLDLYLGPCIKTGLDIQLMHQFGNSRCRRIKTNPTQTDLFLLAKAETFKDFGLTQQFSFYWQFHNFWHGLACKVAYQFYKHGENTLYVSTNQYSTLIANTAESLHSYTTHDVFFILDYDIARHMRKDTKWVPYVAAFVDIPFNGRRAIVQKAAGFIFAVDF